MDIHKTSKTIAVIAAIATGILGTISFLLIFGGNSQMGNVPNTLCGISLFVMLVAYVISRFTKAT